MIDLNDVQQFNDLSKKIFQELKKDFIGQEEIVEEVIIALISSGNILLEGVPGVGKTRLVRSLSQLFDLSFVRIQFTPDLMPNDIIGTNLIINENNSNNIFQFKKGPIFNNIILADEINRANAKTQSALLEAMQEHRVSVNGITYKIDEPFFVIATQNPLDLVSTYPLPEAQLDRFMFKLIIKNPNLKEVKEIVNMTQINMHENAQKVCSKEELIKMGEVAKNVFIAKPVLNYALSLCSMANTNKSIKQYLTQGISPRASQALINSSKVLALLKGRYNVSYSDIDHLIYPILRHRLKLSFEAITNNYTPDDIIKLMIDICAKNKNGGNR